MDVKWWTGNDKSDHRALGLSVGIKCLTGHQYGLYFYERKSTWAQDYLVSLCGGSSIYAGLGCTGVVPCEGYSSYDTCISFTSVAEVKYTDKRNLKEKVFNLATASVIIAKKW